MVGAASCCLSRMTEAHVTNDSSQMLAAAGALTPSLGYLPAGQQHASETRRWCMKILLECRLQPSSNVCRSGYGKMPSWPRTGLRKLVAVMSCNSNNPQGPERLQSSVADAPDGSPSAHGSCVRSDRPTPSPTTLMIGCALISQTEGPRPVQGRRLGVVVRLYIIRVYLEWSVRAHI